MKLLKKNWLYLFVTLLAAVGTIHLTLVTFSEWYTWYMSDYEKICYLLWGIAFLMTFRRMAAGCKKLWTKLSAGVGISLLYTAFVFFLNNYWRCVAINGEFAMDPPFSLATVMGWDITYTNRLGEYRYPAVFAVMLALCGLILLWTRSKNPTKWLDRFLDWLALCDLKKRSLDEVYREAREMPEIDGLVDYINRMLQDEAHKAELMEFMDQHQDRLLIRLFLRRFEELVTREEYLKYKAMYVRLFEAYIKEGREYFNTATVEFTDIFEQLDQKFELD